MIERDAASFRDPSGSVHMGEKEVFRTIAPHYAREWEELDRCGLLAEARGKGLLDFRELASAEWPESLRNTGAAKILVSPRLPFLSWPCEWSFSQLRDAALLTLDLHLLALDHDCILKDASAYNIQFLNSKPVFIDLLSFEHWQKGQPWQAYGQFCRHFLAPLALMARRDLRLGLMDRLWLDGIPLDIAGKLLPWKTRIDPGLALHLHLHATMCNRHADGREAAEKVKKSRMKISQLKDVADSLHRLVKSLALKEQSSEWGDYYQDTNYTASARKAKEEIVTAWAKSAAGGSLAVDLGANTGEFSALLAPHFAQVLATDSDSLAVERNYISPHPSNVLPLVLDIAQPTPAYGWRLRERASFVERCHADLLMALALCHHLVFTCGLPFREIACGFGDLLKKSGKLIVEFVPRDDSQTQRLLAARDDIFAEYDRESFVAAFENAGFILLAKADLPESKRELMLFEKH